VKKKKDISKKRFIIYSIVLKISSVFKYYNKFLKNKEIFGFAVIYDITQ